MMIKWSEVVKENKQNEYKLGNVVDRLDKSQIHWSAKTVKRMHDNGELNFENALQRALVWDNDRKSLFIDTAIRNFIVDPIKAIRNNGVYDILDGKQRLLGTIISFMNDEFELTGMKLIPLSSANDDQEDFIDINNLKYSELPECIQCLIDELDFTVDLLDENTPEEDVNETFFRCNNYKPMSAIDLTRAKAKSQKDIYSIAQHKLFTDNFTSYALSKYKNEEVVMKTYIMLHDKEPNFNAKYIRNYIMDVEFTDEDIAQITQVFDRIYDMYNVMKSRTFDNIEDKKEREKAQKRQLRNANKILSLTHLTTSIPIIVETMDDGLSVEEAAQWFEEFFNGTRKATNCALYNEASCGGSGKKENIQRRLRELKKNYAKFKKIMESKKEEVTVTETLVQEAEVIAEETVTEEVIEKTV